MLANRHLRSHLSVISQVPILFCGTLRYNIDPLEQFSNDECFTALEAVQLKQLVCNHPNGLHLLIAESSVNMILYSLFSSVDLECEVYISLKNLIYSYDI